MDHRGNILRPLFLILVLSVAVFISPRLVFDDSLRSWVPPESDIINDYKAFLEEFKSDAMIIVALVDVPDTDSIARQISELEHVKNVGPWPAPLLKYKTMAPDNIKAIYISFLPPSYLNPNRPALVQEIRDLLDSTGMEYHMAGTGVIHQAINDLTNRSSKKYLLIGIILLSIFLVLFTRDLRTILTSLGISLGSVAWVMIAAYLLDIRFNTIMSLLPSLILFYSTSVSVHILNHQGNIKKVIWPTLIAVLTTCAGFSAFLMDPAPLLRDFGLLAIIGLTGSLFWALVLFYPRESSSPTGIRFKARLASLEMFWNYKSVILGLILVGVLIPGAVRVESKINTLSILPRDHPTVQDYSFIEQNLGPFVPVEYLVDRKMTSHVAVMEWIDDVYELDEVGAVMSYFAFPPLMNPGRYGYISEDGRIGRIVFFVPLTSTSEGMELVREIDELSEKHFTGSQVYPKPTGYVSLYVSVADHLSKSFRQSLLLAFLFVFLVIFLFLRNFRLFLASILPNIFPVLAILGVMGWFKIPLDMVTVPMGCLALGIIVDDTIHYLYWYRKTGSVQLALENAGPGTITTSIIYIAGFSVFLFADANPVKYFGILSITTMVTALFGDIVLLPYIIKRMA